MNRYTKSHRCPICGGSNNLRRGKGRRCFGYISDDRLYAHCTREEYAGALDINLNSSTFAHRLSGPCNCGENHDGSTGMPQSPPIVAEYNYNDANGALLYQNVRFAPKDFRMRRPDGRGGWTWQLGGTKRVLYRLPELLAADPVHPVYITEGEKDTDNLIRLPLIASTNIGGAGKWRPEYCEPLRGRDVILLPDNDEPGREHMRAVAGMLKGIAASVKIVELPGLPPKGDVSDWIAAGGTTDQLHAIVDSTAIHSAQASEHAVVVWAETNLRFRTAAEIAQRLWRQECADPSPEAFIFATARKSQKTKQRTFISTDNYRKRVMRRLAQELGLPKLTFQVLRRSIATLAQQKGSLKDVQGILGHDKIETTGNVYVQELTVGVVNTVGLMYAELTAKPDALQSV